MEFAKKYISPLTGKPIFDAVYLNTALPTTSLKPQAKAKSTQHVGNDTEVGDVTGQDDDDHEHESVGDLKWEHAKLRAQGWIKELDLVEEEGVDRVVEASGAEDSMLLGIAIAKQGATCESPPLDPREKASMHLGVELTVCSPASRAEPCPNLLLPEYRSHQQRARRQG